MKNEVVLHCILCQKLAAANRTRLLYVLAVLKHVLYVIMIFIGHSLLWLLFELAVLAHGRAETSIESEHLIVVAEDLLIRRLFSYAILVETWVVLGGALSETHLWYTRCLLGVGLQSFLSSWRDNCFLKLRSHYLSFLNHLVLLDFSLFTILLFAFEFKVFNLVFHESWKTQLTPLSSFLAAWALNLLVLLDYHYVVGVDLWII